MLEDREKNSFNHRKTIRKKKKKLKSSQLTKSDGDSVDVAALFGKLSFLRIQNTFIFKKKNPNKQHKNRAEKLEETTKNHKYIFQPTFRTG